MRLCLTLLAAAVLATSLALAPGPQRGVTVQLDPGVPPRDRPEPPKGTAAIEGRVVDGATGAAVGRARVRLMGPGGPRPLTTADAAGRFAFTELPAGPYTITVEKATYQPSRYPEAGRSMRTAMRRLVLGDGEVKDGLAVPIYRGGVLAGRVVDAYGDPVESVEVRVLRVPRSGSGRPTMRGGNGTNDIGEFRIARLEPGTYLLQAIPHNRNPEEVEEAPVPTYYPGVAGPDQAVPLTLERGQSLTGLDFMLVAASSTLVSGTVVDAEGGPVRGGYVNARAIVTDGAGGWGAGGTGVRPDGTFQIRLAPGEYQLDANVSSPQPSGGPPRPEDQQFGTVRLPVGGGGALTGVTITTGRSATVSGRFVFDGTSPLPPSPQQVRVGFQSRDGGFCRSGRSEVTDEWTFTVTGVSGTCTPFVSGGTGRWLLKAVLHENADLTDRSIAIEPGEQLSGLQVVFTDRRTELTLQVTDSSGQPTREYVAVAFPTDKDRWTPNSRYIRTLAPPPLELLLASRPPAGARGLSSVPSAAPPMRPDMISGLPPGEYYVVAVADLDPEDPRDPARLEELARHAVRVALADGARVTVPLRVQ